MKEKGMKEISLIWSIFGRLWIIFKASVEAPFLDYLWYRSRVYLPLEPRSILSFYEQTGSSSDRFEFMSAEQMFI